MSHYDFNRMGWQQFEHMFQALAKKELGNGVTAFGGGRDAQREATFKGKVAFPNGSAEGPWNGYGVLQAKYMEKPKDTTADWRWFLLQVRNELAGWLSKKRVGEKTPEYLLFATNVTLTGTGFTGGRDSFEDLLSEAAAELGLKGWYAWDSTELRTLLDNNAEVRRRYLETIIVGDILVQLESLLPQSAALTAKRLASHAAGELANRQWVRTGDSGFRDNSKYRLADIGIDLPGIVEPSPANPLPQRQMTASAILAVADEVPVRREPRGVVILGGPGQGKSTLGQLIAHRYRINFLRAAPEQDFGTKVDNALQALAKRLDAAGVHDPKRRRWPMFVDMAHAGKSAADYPDAFSFLEYLGAQLLVGGERTSASALFEWMRNWPVCLVLDGLDEVPNARTRARLLEAIGSFVTDAAANDVDLFVVATTRPLGYHREFADFLPSAHIELSDLTEKEALDYSDSLVQIRTADDPDLAKQVTERLLTAVHERVTQKLMRSPLQVTIMTALAEREVELPSDRYGLFDDYYGVVYDRELQKGDDFRALRALRSHIDRLHEHAALQLHKRAERSSSDGTITHQEVSKILRTRLVEAGFDNYEAEDTTRELLQLSTERLVMLVARRPRVYEFEVRSLQEYMAARAITDGEDDEELDRLRLLLPSSHWRNTWMLAAGRVLRTREHLLDRLLAIIVETDKADPESEVIAAGAFLAADLFVDHLGEAFPKVRRQLLESLCEPLGQPILEVPASVKDAISMALDESAATSKLVLERLEAAARGLASSAAARVLSEHPSGGSEIAQLSRLLIRSGAAFAAPESRGSETRAFVLGEYLGRVMPDSPDVQKLVDDLKAWKGKNGPADDVFFSDTARAAVVRAISLLRQRQPDVAAFAADILRVRRARIPFGQQLTLN